MLLCRDALPTRSCRGRDHLLAIGVVLDRAELRGVDVRVRAHPALAIDERHAHAGRARGAAGQLGELFGSPRFDRLPAELARDRERVALELLVEPLDLVSPQLARGVLLPAEQEQGQQRGEHRRAHERAPEHRLPPEGTQSPDSLLERANTR